MPTDVPNVLADRYASPAMLRIWSPVHKVVLERELWLAVLESQQAMGVNVPPGVIEAYRGALLQVDLESIAARERVTPASQSRPVVSVAMAMLDQDTVPSLTQPDQLWVTAEPAFLTRA